MEVSPDRARPGSAGRRQSRPEHAKRGGGEVGDQLPQLLGLHVVRSPMLAVRAFVVTAAEGQAAMRARNSSNEVDGVADAVAEKEVAECPKDESDGEQRSDPVR